MILGRLKHVYFNQTFLEFHDSCYTLLAKMAYNMYCIVEWQTSNKSLLAKFYRRLYELVSTCIFNVGLKTLLHQGLSEPEFYGDLVYKFKKKCR